MTAALQPTDAATMTPAPTKRWWESAREGRIFCGPQPHGHHIPAMFDFTESGFIQCQANRRLPDEFDRLKRFKESGQYAAADKLEAAIRGAGVDVPSLDELRAMARDTGSCGRWVFMFAIRGGGVIVAQVSPDERRAMKKLSTQAEMLEYLQIFPTR